MRIFQKSLCVFGPSVNLFRYSIISNGGKYDNYRNVFVIPESRKIDVEKISVEEIEKNIDAKTKKVTEKKITKKLIDECKIEYLTDPTPLQTIKRVGRNYLGEDVSKYIIVSIPNDIYLTMETEIRQAKDIQLGNLSDPNTDGSYDYYDGLFTIIPPDPPTAEEVAEQEAQEKKKQDLANTVQAIRNAPDNSTIEQKAAMAFDYLKALL